MTPLRRPRLGAMVLLLGSVLAGCIARAQAPGPDAVLRGFERTGDYQLVVNGKPQPAAEIYQLNKGIPAFLILSSAFPSPVLISSREGTVQTVQLMKVVKRPDGSVDLMADAALSPQGEFEVQGEEVHFQSEGRKAVLQTRPPLLGLKRGSDLLAYSPDYARGAKAYKPNAGAIEQLRKRATPVRVRVFFGSWCPHCKEHVPMVLKMEELLKTSKIQFEYWGLKPGLADPDSKRFGIHAVPTGVVFVNGREVGRLASSDWQAPETALASLLAGKKNAG